MSDLILVGTDGSPRAGIAVQRAAEMASALNARLHIICAYAAEAPATLTDKRGEPESAEAHRIAESAASSVADTGVAVTAEAVLGNPSEALLESAETSGARMIVVGNRRVQGLARVLGSVASAVAHRADCDVLVVHTS